MKLGVTQEPPFFSHQLSHYFEKKNNFLSLFTVKKCHKNQGKQQSVHEGQFRNHSTLFICKDPEMS